MWKYSQEKQLSPVCSASKYDYLVLLLSIRTQILKNVWPINSKLTAFLFIIILFRSHSLHIQSNAWCVNKYVYIFSCLLGKLMWRQSTVEWAIAYTKMHMNNRTHTNTLDKRVTGEKKTNQVQNSLSFAFNVRHKS